MLYKNLEQIRNMTELSSISDNHFAFECQCIHVALVPVKLFLDRYGPDAWFKDMVKKAGAVKLMRTPIRLLVQPIPMPSIIDATQ